MAALFGLGNPLLDISVDAEQPLFDKYALTCPNAILAEESHLPLYAEIQAAPYTPVYVAGGSCQNSIRVAQWMLQKEGSTAYTGCVGKDADADILRQCAQKDGVKVDYAVSDTRRTGRCAVLIHQKDRSMCTDLEAASTFTTHHLKEKKAVWENAEVIAVEGYFLTVSEESVVALAKHQMANKKTFAFSLSAPFICQFFTAGVKNVLEYANLVFGNESEAELIATALGWELGNDHVAIAKKLAAYPFAEGVDATRKVIITRGADEVVVATSDAANLYPVIKLPVEKILDLNGAGDAFCGGYLAGLVSGQDEKKCVEAGNFASSTIIQTSGTNLDMPNTFQW